MAIALRGSAVIPTGGQANPTTGYTCTIPSQTQTGDVLLLTLTSRDSTGLGSIAVTDNDTGGNTWTNFAHSGTDYRLTLWWKRATSGTASKTLTVAGCVGSCSGVLKVFSGVTAQATPYANATVAENAAGTESQTGFTPTYADSMVLAAVANYNNDNAVTNLSFATLGATTMTECLSTGGSDCANAFGHALSAGGPNATGNLTWTQTDGVTKSAVWTLFPPLPVTVNPSKGALAFAVYTPIVSQTVNQSVAPTKGALSFSGQVPTVEQVAPSINPLKGALSFAGYQPTLAQTADQIVAPSKGALALVGHAATVLQPRELAPTKAALSFNGYAPAVSQSLAIQPGKGALTLAGYAPTLTRTAHQTVAPAQGALTFAGHAPSLTQPNSATPSKGSLSFAGYVPAVSQFAASPIIACTKGALTFTGHVPAVGWQSAVVTGGGRWPKRVTQSLWETDLFLPKSVPEEVPEPEPRTVACSKGRLTLVGNVPTLVQTTGRSPQARRRAVAAISELLLAA